MCASFSGSLLPKDVWMEIFRVMDDLGDFEGLKCCSCLNRVFRAALAPHIFASAAIIQPVLLSEIQLRLKHVSHFVNRLSIRPGDDTIQPPWNTALWKDPAIIGLIGAYFRHVESLSLMKFDPRDLDDSDLNTFLISFPVLKKLSLLQDCAIDLEWPDNDHQRSGKSTALVHSTNHTLSLEELNLDCGHMVIMSFLQTFLGRAGHSLRRLKTSTQSSRLQSDLVQKGMSCLKRVYITSIPGSRCHRSRYTYYDMFDHHLSGPLRRISF
jgi:hypothetical protein